jgi:predicted RND superfamily exporter protein
MGFAGMFAMNIASIQQFVGMIIILLVMNMVMAMFLFPALALVWVKRRKHPPPPEGVYVAWMKRIQKNLKFGPPAKPAAAGPESVAPADAPR